MDVYTIIKSVSEQKLPVKLHFTTKKSDVTLEQARGKTIKSFLVQKVCQEFLGDFGIFRLSRVLHGVFEKVVLFAKFHALFPSVISFIEVGGDTPELDKFVTLQLLCQSNVVE